MNLTTILAIVALVLVCVLPFVIMNLKHKKFEKKFLHVLLDHASKSGITISRYDILSNQIIGISEAGDAVLHLRRRNDKDQILQVDLTQIDRCYVNKPTRSSVDGNYSATDRIELRFTSRDKSKPETVFELYNLEHDSMSMNGELQLSEKWQTIVNDGLKKRNKV